MFLEEFLDTGCVVVGCRVQEQDDSPCAVPPRVRGEIAQMPTELHVCAMGERVPHDALSWPEKGDEAVYSLGIAERGDIDDSPPFRPASLDFWKEIDPLLVLEADEDVFFERAAATCLYRRICSLLR